MSKTIIQHKNQEIEVVTRRSRKGRRPMFGGSRPVTGGRVQKDSVVPSDLFASLEQTPKLSTTLPRLSSVEKGRT